MSPLFVRLLVVLVALLPLAMRADPEDVVREAATRLANTSYRWETTVRQKFTADTAEPRLDPNAAVEVEGRIDPNTYMEITLRPSKQALPVPVVAIFRSGNVVAKTPLGWMHRSEMRSAPRPDRTVDFEGEQMRVSRALAVCLRATTQRSLTEELFDLLPELKSWRETNGLILAELREGAIEKLWGDAQAKRAPEVQGTVIFRTGEQGLAECHFVLAIGFPNSRTKKTAWTMQQWSTRIRSIGSTIVDPPAEAVKRLDE